MAATGLGLWTAWGDESWDPALNRGKNPLMSDNTAEQRKTGPLDLTITPPLPPAGPSPYGSPFKPQGPSVEARVFNVVQNWLDLRPLTSPLPGAHVSPYDNHLPGAPRAYRKGFHEGLDYYSREYTGVDVRKGTAAVAVADGVVIRSDLGYEQQPVKPRDQMLALQNWKDLTTPPALDILRGRQLWIRLGEKVNGVSRVARYCHLSGIVATLKPGTLVKKGQVVAFVGNSGTSNGAMGSSLDMHLHFELRLGVYEDFYELPVKSLPKDTFIGQGLKPAETRKVYSLLYSDQPIGAVP